MLDALERHYSFRTTRLVIHNGRSFAPPEREKERFVLGTGRFWDEAKNVAALQRVRKSVPWPVVLLGSGSPLGRLPSAEVATYVARASIFAAPARYEPFGLSALEAALAGCALVLGDIRSLREIWGDAAVYVAPDNQPMLAAAIARLATDEALRADMGARAQRRARSLDGPRMADQYCGAYQELTGEV